MVSKIQYNKWVKKVTLKGIRLGKNQKFYIWDFEDDNKQKNVGFSTSNVYYGNKTHLWYSLLIGYFLPHSYTINFENVINKECYIVLDNKGIVRSIIPLNQKEGSKDENLFR